MKSLLSIFLALFLTLSLLSGSAQAGEKRPEPPKYDLIFAIYDYGNTHDHLSVQFVVKDGVLKAQFTKSPPNTEGYWKKLYRYDAATKIVRELDFGRPPDADKSDRMVEETVEATAGLKLDTATTSPDGYSLKSHQNRPVCYRCPLSYPCLSKNGVDLELVTNNNSAYPGTLEFVGWVISMKTSDIAATTVSIPPSPEKERATLTSEYFGDFSHQMEAVLLFISLIALVYVVALAVRAAFRALGKSP